MKKIFYLICLALLLFLHSCTIPHNCCTLPQPATKVTAEKNGANWSPVYARGVLSPLDTLSLSAINEKYQSPAFNKIDTLGIKIYYVSSATGAYKLKDDDAFYGVFNNGALTNYKLDTTFNNVINITSYERINGDEPNGPFYARITGTFSLKFIGPNNPSGIVFQNGNFYSALANQ